jgi:hypothetical protein
MASEQQVKRYLAYWFQLGKKVVTRNGESTLLPQPIMAGDRYSQEFEKVWQQIISADSGDSYLESTDETIAELLTPGWEVAACARCEMPIPTRAVGMPPEVCPCCDLASWPNTDLPGPRGAVCSQGRLGEICDRLHRQKGQGVSGEDVSTCENKDIPTLQESTPSQDRLSKIRDRLHNANL